MTHTDTYRDDKGRFTHGAPGRPKGAVNKISARMIQGLLTDFEANSGAVLAHIRVHHPVEYFRAIGRILAKVAPSDDEVLEPLKPDPRAEATTIALRALKDYVGDRSVALCQHDAMVACGAAGGEAFAAELHARAVRKIADQRAWEAEFEEDGDEDEPIAEPPPATLSAWDQSVLDELKRRGDEAERQAAPKPAPPAGRPIDPEAAELFADMAALAEEEQAERRAALAAREKDQIRPDPTETTTDNGRAAGALDEPHGWQDNPDVAASTAAPRPQPSSVSSVVDLTDAADREKDQIRPGPTGNTVEIPPGERAPTPAEARIRATLDRLLAAERAKEAAGPPSSLRAVR